MSETAIDSTGRMILERALVLLDLRRYSEAEKLLGVYLARFPQDAYAHALLAHALSRQPGRHEDALREAQAAVWCDPNLVEGYYALGITQFRRDPLAAQVAFERVLRIDPQQSRIYFSLGSLHLFCGRLRQALDMALEGRKMDAQDVLCANLQAVALMRMGCRKEAAAVAREALSLDPENAQAHAAQGWSLLMESQPDLARVSFGQALRIEPHLENAREGLVEAMKARWPFYGALLRVLLMIEQQKAGRWSWAVLLALFVPPVIGLLLIESQPGIAVLMLAWFVLPIAIGVLARLARPTFDLLLRLDPYARLSLSREQRIISNWVIVGPIIIIASVFFIAITGQVTAGVAVFIVLLIITRLLLGAANPDARKDDMRPF